MFEKPCVKTSIRCFSSKKSLVEKEERSFKLNSFSQRVEDHPCSDASCWLPPIFKITRTHFIGLFDRSREQRVSACRLLMRNNDDDNNCGAENVDLMSTNGGVSRGTKNNCSQKHRAREERKRWRSDMKQINKNRTALTA